MDEGPTAGDRTSAFDYVVVGAGSAGCVVAARLAAIPGTSVLLLDAGVRSRSPLIRIPGGVRYLVGNPRFDWNYLSEPDASREGARIRWSAGRVVGGGSAINGLVFNRGLARDYDDWAAQGCEGWSAAQVRPWFSTLESFSGDAGGGALPPAGRGRDGPVSVEFNRYRPALVDAWLAACAEAGTPVVADVNGFPDQGVGRSQGMTSRGRRQTSAEAYLAHAGRNLELRTQARALRLAFDGRRCTGVHFERAGRSGLVSARREVIVCAGAFGSPQLLMSSGLGPAAMLREHGIPVVHALEGVGRNLQDHAGVGISLSLSAPAITAADQRPWNALRHGLRWLLSGRGKAAGATMVACGFARSDAAEVAPDIALQLCGFGFAADAGGVIRLDREPALTTFCSVARPLGRGTLELASADPHVPLRGALELLGHEDDRRRLLAGLRLVQRIHASAALRPLTRCGRRGDAPGPDDAVLLAYARSRAGSQYHAAGTCRMGLDALAVVDPRLRVHGVAGLRIADASVMPRLTSGNTHAPVLMIAERAAAFTRQAHD